MPDLSLGVTLAVLGAALAHAIWNAMIKSSREVLLDMTLVVFFAGLATAPFLPLVEVPAPAVWPYIAGSMVIHIAYYVALVGAYRAGDLSHGYPLMRGLAPLIVSLCALAWLGEAPRPLVWVGVLLICGGVLSLGLRRLPAGAIARSHRLGARQRRDHRGLHPGRRRRRARRRHAGDLCGVAFRAGRAALSAHRLSRSSERSWLPTRGQFWLRGLFGGALSAAAYGVVLWAMTRAPVAAVAALRETSVIFAALIGAWLLKEGHIARRIAGAATVAAGVIALKI